MKRGEGERGRGVQETVTIVRHEAASARGITPNVSLSRLSICTAVAIKFSSACFGQIPLHIDETVSAAVPSFHLIYFHCKT